MDLGKYKAVTKPLTIEVEPGENINLTYRPNVLSLGDSRLDREGMTHEDRAQEFLQLVASWDLEFEPGVPVPLTVEGLMEVPLNVLLAIDQALADALVPSEEEKGGSSGPSVSPPAASDSSSSSSPSDGPTSLNGSETSASPIASESVPTS